MTQDEILSEILGSRPAGYFDNVRGLLERYAELRLEFIGLWPRLHKLRPGTEQSTALTIEICAKMEAAWELAEVLHLLPGQRRKDPPRLQ
jgi:hypothetical protein